MNVVWCAAYFSYTQSSLSWHVYVHWSVRLFTVFPRCFHYFSSDHNGDVLEVLCDEKVDHTSRNPKLGSTPLHLAVHQGNDTAVEMLVERLECDVNVKVIWKDLCDQQQ